MPDIKTMPEEFDRQLQIQQHIIDVASGRKPADLVLKNATYVNVFSGTLETCDIAVAEGYTAGLGSYSGTEEVDMTGKIVCPGFIDAHIHLESSLVSPAAFVRAVLPHGTTAVITDPHEIANVMGTDGINYMLQATKDLPVDVRFMVPSCVPATPMDESGAELDYQDIEPFYNHPRVLGLAEMMNFPGVISGDTATLSKLVAARLRQKKIDGHAPGLNSKGLAAYVASGVCSDHECSTIEEAREKLMMGQYIMLREGTAAKNLEALVDLLKDDSCYTRCMFCTDDKHPNDLLEKGHIDYICRNAVRLGANPIRVVQAASYNVAQYFALGHQGAIAPGYQADFAVVDNLHDFRVSSVYKMGKCVCQNGNPIDFAVPEISPSLQKHAHDTFHLPRVTAADFAISKPKPVLGMVSGQLITLNLGTADHVNLNKDILKIAVVERHKHTGHIGLGYIHGYGLQTGAVATSVAHDSHNIICVGTNDEDMAFAVNRISEMKGGIVVVENRKVLAELSLEIAGLMSDRPLPVVNSLLEQAKTVSYGLGVSKTIDPFMTLSFMSLPVIPSLRVTTQGVFDVETQRYL